MSNPKRRGPVLNPSEGIATIHFLYQIISLKVHGCTRTCVGAKVFYGGGVPGMGFKFLVNLKVLEE